MPSRLAGALRELAAALEEEDWELVGSNSGEDPVVVRGPAADSGKDQVAKRGPKAKPAAARQTTTSSAASSSRSSVSRVERASAVRGDAVDTTASSNVYHQDIRTYLVLSNPLEPSFVGWVQGPASVVWPRLEARLPGGQLFGSRVRLRKVADVDAAQNLWNQHRPGVPLPKLPL